ncbi:glycosyltransferase family 2 protein [Pedobacter alluvionis]|uniref:Glycosyltransferase family 2 protein n=1 Tax=Pedobacter alluvionis TaxID=475253 RepID=A0A497XYT5_9SPHI|nr:glycosyltransferase family A protein [Pedobacter alluvionis]RLJ73897.1 glycosyltransferase involved in cell wall biosynthesis [Pedobacter alluvionis]TFB32496.1 glycosyltransferase family 2 protein [Pedobacter alluvionis]
MKISIIIPYFRGEILFERLLLSIVKAITKLDKVSDNFEVITIIDSVETPRAEIEEIKHTCFASLKNTNYKIIKNESNLGVAASRNAALKIAKGEFIHLIDQDDEVHENFYSNVQPVWSKFNFILNNGVVFYENKKFNSHKLYYVKPELTLKGFLKDDFIRSPGQVLFKKDLLKGFLFPEPKRFKGTDDRFFWIKMFTVNKNIKPYYLAYPGYIAYIHEHNYSADLQNMKMSELENWLSFPVNEIPKEFNNLVKNDILRIRLTLGEKLIVSEKITAIYTKLLYFCRLNKIIRFINKRKKW